MIKRKGGKVGEEPERNRRKILRPAALFLFWTCWYTRVLWVCRASGIDGASLKV